MTDDSARGREYTRLAFVLGCVLALVLAATLLPTITAAFERGPLESLLTPGTGGTEPGAGGSGTSLGSLDPATSTSVGNLDGATSQSLRSQGAAVHFRVESTAPAYWRTGAYGTYTGTGWEQRPGTRPLEGDLDPPPRADETVSYRVRLERTARALPTVWQPRGVSLSSVAVTERNALRSERPLGPGRTYEGVSSRPVREPGVLATAGTDYPTAVADRYTQLPADTPERLVGFTDRLTADADSPYETARRIERFLERNKTYSLDVEPPETDHVASTFVFGMDRGYCEYFATSMTTMLRTQGVPARYVVGYSTGQRTGERTYTVRGMNAHAWVEVYFPDVGWVRFDPTPGAARLATERQALQRQRPDAPDYNHTETGSPGETFTPAPTPPATADGNRTVPTATPGTGDDAVTNFTGDNFTFVTPDPLPVTTTDDDTDGARDPPSGGTDPDTNGSDAPVDGYRVSLSRPPAPGATVTVRLRRDGDPVPGETVLFEGDVVGVTDANGTTTAEVPFVERLTVAAVTPGLADDATDETINRTFDVETEARLSISGAVATGRSVLVTATVGGTPLPNATVSLEGARLGRTDDRGRIDVTLPDRPGNATLSVSRDPVRGSRGVRVPELTVAAEPTLPLALPWSGVRVTARLDGDPAPGVAVTLDGERVATTGVDGTATATLPLADRARLTVAADGQRATATVAGLWANLALSLGTLAVVVGGVVWIGRRRERPVRDAVERLAAVVDAAVASLVAWLIAAADLLVRAGLAAGDALGGALSALVGLATGRLSAADLGAGLREWLAGVRTAAEPGDDGPTEHEVRLAWRRLLDRATVERPATRTPGEIATHAVERDGLPEDHVRTLRDAFRDVEYGAFDPETWAGEVETAIETIEREGGE